MSTADRNKPDEPWEQVIPDRSDIALLAARAAASAASASAVLALSN
jgi:hypothetical protein